MVMAKRNKLPKDWTDEDRREHGYMTIDEFVEKFAFGLKEYLHTNWKTSNKDDVLHP